MNRRLLLWMVTAIMAIVGVQQAKAYSTSELESAGWTKVTDMTSMTPLSDYYFILIDAGSSLYSVSNARPGTDSKPTYQTLQDPISDAGQVWKISNDGSAYYFQSLVDDWYFIGARNSGEGWTDHMAAESTNGNFTFAVTDGKFSITSVFANGLVGPWEDADHVDLNYKLHWNALEDNFYEELACNKGAQHAPGFYIYAISRATYDNIRRSSSKLAANGWTQVTGTDQLGKSGYYYTLLDVSETGYESGLVMAGGTGRPNYQAMNISTDNKIQIWTMASKGDGYQMKNCETDTYVFCNNGTDWNTGFTNDANNQYTEFRFTLNNGFGVISNVNSLQRSLGRWSNSPYRPGTGENIAANKADNEGKRQFLIYSIPSIAGIAIALPEGGAMTADQWYYFDVISEEEYSFNTTTATDIVWTADGTLLESEANSQATALPSGNTNLTAGRYYIKSSSDNNFVLEAPRPTTAQIAELQNLITAGDAKILGFDNGEYAPYNNVEAITLLADAKTLDLNNPNQYTQSFIAGKIAAMQNATWTANTSEVNAIYWKTNYTAADKASDNYIHPLGWTNTGYNTRIMNSETTSDAGISAVGGTAIMAKFNTTYGETQGYTMPLNANTYYKIAFKYCGWGNNPTTNVVLTRRPNGGVTVTPASFKPETNDGNSNANNWYEYTAIFKTGADAGDYVLALNKVEGGQQQIAWGDMVLVRATAEDLTYTLETGAMNAGVAAAQQTAADTFKADETFEKYEALLTAIEAAKASEAEYVLINNRINLLKAQLGDIPVAEAEADAFVTNYANGVYENLGQVIPAYQTFVQNYWSTNTPGENADLTAFIVNNSFEFGNTDGWGHSTNGDTDVKEASNGTYRFTNSDGNYIFNTWTGNQELHYIFQEIENLPNGTYEVTAVWAGWGDRELTFTANQFTTSETWDEVTDTFKPGDVQDGANETVGIERTIQAVVVNHKLRVGGRSDQFFKCDNFRLTYLSADATVKPTIPEGPMNKDVKAALEQAEEAYDAVAGQTIDNYNALVTAIDNANASIAIYQTMNKYITKQKVTANGVISWTTIDDKYNAGEYLNATDFIADYKALVVAALGNTTTTGTDMTAYAINPSFEYGDMTSWAYYRNGDSRVWENSNATYTMSNVDGDYLFNTWNNNTEQKYLVQEINGLPNGTYRVTAVFGSDADYTIEMTAESSGKEEVNNFTTGENKSVGVEKTVDVVVEDGTLKIGAHGNDWFKVDNFRITFLTTDADMPYALVDAPMNAAIEAEQTAAAAAYESNKSFDNYHRLEAAIAAAQASADKYVIINARIPKLAAQSDGIDVTALTTKYNDGDYVEADDVFDAYRDIIATYYETNAPADNTDLTEFIINPSFEFGDTDGWALNPSNDTGVKSTDSESSYRMTNSDGDWLFNTWSNNNAFLYIVQELTGLPQGTYELTATFAAYNDTHIEFTAENVLPDSTINEVKLAFKPYDEDSRADANTGQVKTLRFYVTDGTLKVGAHAWGFFKCDNYQLKFINTDIESPDLTQPMNQYERGYYQAALAAYTAEPTQENLREVIKYKLMVENSIEAYKAAKKTLDRVQAMMSKTNVYTYDAYFTIDDMFEKYGFRGYYGFETLEDDVAFDLERMFFGTGRYRNYDSVDAENPVWQGDIPAVPFIASAWDCGNDGYAYRGKYEGDRSWQEGDDYYANTWSTEGLDDGTNMLNPYLEYWLYGDQLLAPRTMTATIEGTPGAEYTVKMFVRVRTIHDHEAPTGMTIQIGNGTEYTPTWTYVDNETSYYVLNNRYRLWYCDLWDEAFANNLPTGEVDTNGKLRIKFHIKDGSNVTWLSMKDVYVNYGEDEDIEGLKDLLDAEVAYAKATFPLGFDEGEYAPYTNVDELIALRRAEQVSDASKNYFLVKATYDKLREFNGHGDNSETATWTANEEEMNGFYWTDNYTSEDVTHVEWYEYEDDCITPTGWNLIGRNDGFNTGIKKLGVNTDEDAEGMKAIDGETGLYAKYETDYGQEIGYTLPLKKGVKYIMTFTYAYAGEGTCPETRVTLTVPAANADDTADSGLEVKKFTPIENGMDDMSKWYMYRATFTPTLKNNETGEPANYVITFDKDNVDPEPIIFGELTLVRYKEADDVINGDSKDFTYEYEPEFIGTDVQVTRSFNAGAYNTLVLPFKLSGSELKEALGENFDGKVYYYTGVGTTSGENRDYYQLKFEERTGGIFANVPVLFYSDASNPVNNWTNKTFTNMVTKYVKNDLTVDTDVFDFVGTYKTQKIPEGAWYIKADNNFYKSTGSANLQPTRGYFIPYNADGDVILHAKIMGFDIDDEPTGIMAIEEDGTMHVTSGNIYTLDGRLVRQNAKTLEGLPRGTYIVDGKKYMIK
ncbi:MAG: hypothetical protein K5778_09445 [Bacteroidaceae bacterium]|nr:hypothetical protein [Bacteroidaceae bacterium]